MALMEGTLQARAQIVAFLELPADSEGGTPTYQRMQGFTTLSMSKNPITYERQYVDEFFAQSDVVGYSPSMELGFGKYVGNPAHDYIAQSPDNEVTGTAAIINILSVDLTKQATEDNAWLRPFSVIGNTEGDSLNAYTYSGTFAVKGSKAVGKAVVSADGLTATWTETTA